MPVGSTSKTRWEDQVKTRYMLDPATGLPTVGASSPLEVMLPGMEYLGGTSFTLDGSLPKWLSPSPGATTVRISANGGEVYYEINGVSASALSPGYVPDGQSETIGPICNMSAMWFFSATADTMVHVSYWRREGAALAGEWVEPDYWQRVMATNPIAFWPLWETSGTVAHCLVNPAQNGTYSSDVSTWPVGAGPGDGSTAPVFDGTNDYVDVFTAALAAVFDGLTGTFAFWAQVSAAGVWTDGADRNEATLIADASDYILAAKLAGNNQLYYNYRAGGASEATVEGAVSTTDWYHIVMTWDRNGTGNTIFYRNNVQVGTHVIANAWAAALTVALIGSNSPPALSVWDGSVARPAFWDRILTAGERANLYAV